MIPQTHPTPEQKLRLVEQSLQRDMLQLMDLETRRSEIEQQIEQLRVRIRAFRNTLEGVVLGRQLVPADEPEGGKEDNKE